MSFHEVLHRNRRVLLEEIEDTTFIVEVLYTNKFLSKRQYQEINAQPIQWYKTAKLIDILSHLNEDGFLCFCHSLQEEYKWLSELLEKDGHFSSSNSTPEDGCFSADMDKVLPSEKQLMKISRILACCDWESVMIELGLSFSDVNKCKVSHSHSSMQCMSALVHWLRKNGDGAKFIFIYNAAQTSGCSLLDLKQLVSCMK